MVRTYKRKTDRGSYGADALQSALADLEKGMSLNATSKKYGISRATLRRHRDQKQENPGQINLGRFKPVFSKEQELALLAKLKAMDRLLYGLSTVDFRRLAYDFAESLDLTHQFNKTTKLAGKDWMRGFLKRNPSVSIRHPEATSLARAHGFNKQQVTKFFRVLKDELIKHNYTSSSIWNMDETGFTVVQKPGKVLAIKGKKQVGRVTSLERGRNVTAVCAFNAAGNYLPPMLIFPRKRLPQLLMKGAPPDSLGSCSDSGWTDSDNMLKWLKHFVAFAKPSKENPQIIVLDGHHSHKTLEAVTYAKDNGITMVTFPPHCTHKLQPCDKTFFSSLKSAYNTAADNWMVANPGQRITFFEIADLFGKAYSNSATLQKAVNGFASTGLWPLNPDIFTDEDFVASLVTEEEDPDRVNLISVARPVARDPVAGPVAGPSSAGPSTAGPSSAGPSSAGPSTAGPSTAGPVAGPTSAGPSTAESVAGPSNTDPVADLPARDQPVTPKTSS